MSYSPYCNDKTFSGFVMSDARHGLLALIYTVYRASGNNDMQSCSVMGV